MQPKRTKRVCGFFSGNRKLGKKLRFCFWLVTGLLLALLSIQSAVTTKQQQIDDQKYGQWEAGVFDCAPEEKQKILDNPMLDLIGVQSSTGQVVEKSINSRHEKGGHEAHYSRVGYIGYADESFYRLAGLRLKSGSLPRLAGEIAVEADILDELGISYKLGQPVHLLVKTGEDELEEQMFQLCGVLENYSRFWKGSKNLLSFYTAAPEKDGPLDQHQIENVFFTFRSGYTDISQYLGIDPDRVVWNENRQQSSDPFSTENIQFTVLLYSLFCLCALYLMESTAFWLHQHRNEIRLMYIFGVSRRSLCSDLFRLFLKSAGLPVLVLAGGSLFLKIPFWTILLLIIFELSLSLMGFAVLSIYIRRTSLTGKEVKISSSKKRKKQKGPNYCNEKIVLLRLMRQLRPELLAFLCTFLCVQVVWMAGSVSLLQHITTIRSIEDWPDYKITGHSMTIPRYTERNDKKNTAKTWMFNLHLPIDPEDIETIQRNGNLKGVDYLSRRDDFEVSWENISESLPYSESLLTETSQLSWMMGPNAEGKWGFYPLVCYYSQPEKVEALMKEVDEGSVDWENWRQGKEAVIYLPAAEDRAQKTVSSAKVSLLETSLQIDDTIFLTDWEGNHLELPVTGIIRSFKQPLLFNEMNGYTIFIGKEEINEITMNLASLANQLSVEQELSDLASSNEYGFINLAAQKKVDLQQRQIQIILVSSMMLGTLMAFLFLLILFKHSFSQQQDMAFSRMENIGLNRKILRHLRQRLFSTLLCRLVIISGLAYGLFLLLALVNKHSGLGISNPLILTGTPVWPSVLVAGLISMILAFIVVISFLNHGTPRCTNHGS